MPPAGEEAPSGPAPDLSPSLTPEPAAAAAAARAAYGYPCGWTRGAGAAGTRARAEGPDHPEDQRRRSAERCRAGERDGVAGYLRSGTGESLRTQVSPQPQQHKMADTSPRTSRDSALAPPRPLLRPAPPHRPPGSSSLPRHLPFRCLPPLFPDTLPPEPRMSGRRGRGGAAAGRRRRRSPAGLPPALELSRVGVQRWTRARCPVTHRPVRPILSPFTVQKALHHLRADVPTRTFPQVLVQPFSDRLPS